MYAVPVLNTDLRMGNRFPNRVGDLNILKTANWYRTSFKLIGTYLLTYNQEMSNIINRKYNIT